MTLETHQVDKHQDEALILALETSCDETSVAIVRNGRQVLVNLVSSQIDTHRQFGGVVPEVASRKHVEVITHILQQAVTEAGIDIADVHAIAVTHGPGLSGSLLIGMVAAKALALVTGKPLIGVHHIAGHIYANQIEHEIQYPALALVVSGGHTELVLLEAEGQFRRIGQTRDDAAGEAYDKVARALGLPYPGGPHIDRLAHESQQPLRFPRAWLEPDSYDFSFSGLKSAVLAALNQAQMKQMPLAPADVAAGFQESVVDVLVEKAIRATKAFGVTQLLLAGGVAANKGLRQALRTRCQSEQLALLIPSFEYCTDNAAMIGAAAYIKYKKKQFHPLDLKAEALLSLEKW
jgi:N6-L-threonylcarbamoyladenine synthase